MFVFSNLFYALADVLNIVIRVLYLLIIIRALISWVSPDPFNPIVRFLYRTTEPILAPIRRLLPVQHKIGVDISPIIAFLILVFLDNFLIGLLRDLAYRLR